MAQTFAFVIVGEEKQKKEQKQKILMMKLEEKKKKAFGADQEGEWALWGVKRGEETRTWKKQTEKEPAIDTTAEDAATKVAVHDLDDEESQPADKDRDDSCQQFFSARNHSFFFSFSTFLSHSKKRFTKLVHRLVNLSTLGEFCLFDYSSTEPQTKE